MHVLGGYAYLEEDVTELHGGRLVGTAACNEIELVDLPVWIERAEAGVVDDARGRICGQGFSERGDQWIALGAVREDYAEAMIALPAAGGHLRFPGDVGRKAVADEKAALLEVAYLAGGDSRSALPMICTTSVSEER